MGGRERERDREGEKEGKEGGRGGMKWVKMRWKK